MRQEQIRCWEWANLLSRPEQIERRCMAIEHLSSQWPAYPMMRFETRGAKLVRSQKWIADGRSIHRGGDEHAWMRLAEALEAKDDLELVHGDLCVRNIIWSEERGCCLAIDWEPDLIQVMGNQRVSKVTKGYVHPDDWGTSEPFSLKSDRYAFIRCLEQVVKAEQPSSRDDLLDFSYQDLVKHYFNNA
jgi:hypothetical protein